jgi:hypothetical protein
MVFCFLIKRGIFMSSKDRLRLEKITRLTDFPIKHRAFTDIAKWHGKYWVSFREGTDHLSLDGKLVVMSSSDLNNWTRQEFSQDCDLRDSKFLLINEEKLNLYCFGRCSHNPIQTFVYESSNDKPGHSFRTISIDRSCVLWRPRIINKKMYVACYTIDDQPDPDGHARSDVWLYSSDDGIKWQQVSCILKDQEGTETELLADANGNLIAFIRRDGPRFPTMVVGLAEFPYTRWKLSESDKIIHAAAACHWKNHIIVVGRYMAEPFPLDPAGRSKAETLNRKICTMLWSWTPDKGFEELLNLPSQGDCSYAGIVTEPDQLVISYYSQHRIIANDPEFVTLKGGAEVFVAKIKMVKT